MITNDFEKLFEPVKGVKPSKRSLNEAMEDRTRGRRYAYERVIEVVTQHQGAITGMSISACATARWKGMEEIRQAAGNMLEEEKEEGEKQEIGGVTIKVHVDCLEALERLMQLEETMKRIARDPTINRMIDKIVGKDRGEKDG